jgi:hypothetical protein
VREGLTALRSQVSALGSVSSSLENSTLSETESRGNAAIDSWFGNDPVIVEVKAFALRWDRAAKNASAKMRNSLQSDASWKGREQSFKGNSRNAAAYA